MEDQDHWDRLEQFIIAFDTPQYDNCFLSVKDPTNETITLASLTMGDLKAIFAEGFPDN